MCGISAIWGENPSQTLISLIESLKNLQHRGQESFGYVYFNNSIMKTIQNEGLVRDYQLPNNDYQSSFAIGHLRYSTSGSKSIISSQPITNEIFSIVHNGNIPNKGKLNSLLEKGYTDNEIEEFSDTQLLEKYLYQEITKNNNQRWENIFHNLLYTIKGAYCLIILTKTDLWIIRDQMGIRPLIIAQSDQTNPKQIMIASESSVLNSRLFYDWKFQDIEPGSITQITSKGRIRKHIGIIANPKPCLFEFIYFLDPRSVVSGQSVLEFRKKSGELLGKQEPESFKQYFQKSLEKVVVIGAPSTGNTSAEIYAQTLGFRFDPTILTKKPSKERTFILKDNQERKRAVFEKYNYDFDKIKDKIIIIVDDSLVRGNTITIINQQLRECGAKEIHVRIASPEVKYPCLYGIDIPTKEELIANHPNFSSELIKADSLCYLPLLEIKKINSNLDYYQGCFDGIYM